MDLKQKLDSIKTKIKKHQNEIIAVASTGVAIAATVGWKITQDKLEKAYAGNREILDRQTKGETYGHEAVYLSNETTDAFLNGDEEVWFTVRGKRCDLIVHPED
jgi:hypothetical protein